jgi:hypothetical protein
MSWSFQAIGSPEKVAAALEGHSEKINKDPNDYCRKEFDEAKPHLIALVQQNFVAEDRAYSKPVISIQASGSATTERPPAGSGEGAPSRKVQSSVSVEIKSIYGWVG